MDSLEVGEVVRMISLGRLAATELDCGVGDFTLGASGGGPEELDAWKSDRVGHHSGGGIATEPI